MAFFDFFRGGKPDGSQDKADVATEPGNLISIGHFKNETDKPMLIFLEMLCQEIWMSPGHEIELLVEAEPDLLPVQISVVENGLVIYPLRVFDPKWMVRFNGKLIPAGWPTRLSDHE
ncbi:hypothetical protein [Mitsuaria sp. GD03876]|uniref:hypothetical protein n=1 Tax=Mitsuaria sp. GD03876 TaxID=2975399 RepID=UPI0024490E14|nr:hypothetical protein [Mitsuaria sp. GD03876]MDH0864569.1 hypothetical protein [Mitsuaria sp. GD03876]